MADRKVFMYRYTSVMTQLSSVHSAILPVAVHMPTSSLANIHRKANTSLLGLLPMLLLQKYWAWHFSLS